MDLTQEEWSSKLDDDDNAVILDVRREDEVEAGYIPNARNLDVTDTFSFMEEIKKLDTSKNYYVYCRSGKRSATACKILNQNDIANTFNLVGGFIEWEGEVTE